ncbi:hypothetical protein GCM10011415_30620 [Salipiger pallidus]|uniref:Uncharacterized protein n=1 Tax=Salipiger pallidus TaxID=1775170 RepID=A0A8J3EGX1_9RHOB|nr:hypothetical protein [Salipiger pallidus]GGG79326.1 hypothetical protein GCM10011415_30620 [Salipiger pallidus]
MGRLVSLGFGDPGTRSNIEGGHVELIVAMKTSDSVKAEEVALRHVEVFRQDVLATVNASLKASGLADALNLANVVKGADT